MRSANGKPSCMDECCRRHDMCCAPGGDDLQLTHLCNRQMVDCINHCQTLWDDHILDTEDVCRHAIWAAMDMVAGSWCCGRPCPPQVYAQNAADMARAKAEPLYDFVHNLVLHSLTPVLNGARPMVSLVFPEPHAGPDQLSEPM